MSDVMLVRDGERVVAEVEKDPDALRATVRACLRELDEEREAVAHAADLERGGQR